MSLFNKLFGQPEKQRTLLDDVQQVTNILVVRGYRKIAVQHNIAPTSKTTDQKLLEIYTMVLKAFRAASEQKGERIPATILNFISLKCFQVYEDMGEDFMREHLQYEVNKYLTSGLRQDYKQDLPLFDSESNDPDVKRLRDLHSLALQKMRG
jgi:hypothetical protein